MDVEMELHNDDSNSSSAKNMIKKRNKKNKALSGSISANKEGPSLMQEKDSSTANVSPGCSALIEDQPNPNMNSSADKNRRKRERRKMRKAVLKAVNVDLRLQVDVSTKPVSEKDLCVESNGNISSSSALIEVQSNSHLNITRNKKKRKREEKNRRKVLKADNTGDVSIKTVSETAPVQVEDPDDLSKEMDSIAASVGIGAAFDTNMKIMNLSRSRKRKLKRRKKETQNSIGHNDIDHVHPEDSALSKNSVLEKDTSLLSSANMCSEKQPNGHIGLCLERNEVKEVNDGHNESENNRSGNRHMGNGKRYEKKDVKFAPAAAEMDLTRVKEDLLVSEKQSNYSDFNTTENKKKRKRAQKKRREALKAVYKDGDLQEVGSETKPYPSKIEGSLAVSPKLVSDKDSYVESTGKISSTSGLVEVESNSNLNISENKKKRKKEKKEKHKALKADNTNVDLEEKVSEPKTVAFEIEGPVDVSTRTVWETAPVQVEVPDDLSKEMDPIATSVGIGAAVDTNTKITNLSRSQKKKLKRRKKKLTQNSPGHDDKDHVHPEDNALTKNTVLEKDTSLLSSVNMCSEKQPNGHISLCLVKNEMKEANGGHNESENNSTGNRHMGNEKRYEKKDAKFAPAAAELALTRVKEDLLVSEKQSNHSKIKDTSSHEKHDVPASSVNTYKRKKKVKTYSRKKRIEPSDSGENTSDSIKENGTGLASFGHSEAALVTGFSENKLAIELERKNDASVQVLEDITMTEASIDCSDGNPVCKDNENGIKIKISKEDEENLKPRSRDEFKEIKITLQEVSNANGISDENLSRHKEKTSDSISAFDTFCNYQDQTNAEVETKVEEIFPFSSHLGVAKTNVVDDTGREDNLLQKSRPSPERACISHCKKKLLVLDVNGLLADIVPFPPKSGYKPHGIISKKAVFRRPYCDDFLRFCFERFNIGVWSSRIRRNVNEVLKFLMGDLKSNLLFMWDASHCTKTGLNTIENKNKPLVLKELKKLWDKLEPNLPWKKGEYNETNTVLLDDSPYKALRNPVHTAIFPYSYEYYKDANDSSLGPGGDLRVYLEGLAAAENVQEYIKQNPFGQQAITESNPFWGFYSTIIDTNPSQPHDTSSTSSVAVSNVVSRMPLENTFETGFGSKVTLHEAASASASETCNDNMVTPMDIHCS